MTDPAGREYGYTYTSAWNLASYTDPGGGVTQYEYSNELMTKITTPGGRVTKLEYYPAGDPNAGKVKKIIRVTDTVAGTGPTTEFSYVARREGSSDATVTDPSNHKTRYVFDKDGKVEKVTDALGRERQTSYNSNWNVEEYFAASNTSGLASATFNYDSNNNLTGTAVPVGPPDAQGNQEKLTTGAQYGQDGHVPSGTTGRDWLLGCKTNEQGRIDKHSYDSGGNLTKIQRVDDCAAPTSTTSHVELFYDANAPGKLDATEDGKGNRTSYGYDTGGNLTSVDPPLTDVELGKTLITYGGATGADQALSRISTVTDGRGRVTSYEYDARDRVKKITYANGETVTNTWDKDGNLTDRADSANGSTSYTFDDLNRLTRQVGPGARTIDYGYDPSSNLSWLEDAGGRVEYGYNAANEQVSVYEPAASTPVKFEYDKDGRRTKTTYPNGVVTDQSFNDAGQLLSTESKNGSTVLQKFAYAYENASGGPVALRLSVTDKDGAVTSYGYDGLDRLDVAETVSGGSTTAKYDYDYDAASNLTQRVAQGQGTEGYTVNAANQLVAQGLTTFSYDLDGNETAVGTTSSSYNDRGQMSSRTTGGSAVPRSYVGPGQAERLSVGGRTLTHNTLGLGVIADGGTTTYYARDEEGALVSQRTSSTAREYPLFDALGSVRALVDQTGAVVARYDYDPYGRAVATGFTNSKESVFRFASGELDPDGLYHFGERYYNPAYGRWTQRDPLMQAQDMRQVNRYAYVGGDPVNLTDPEGQCFGWDACDDWVDENISYTFEEATGNVLGWAGTAGLCTVSIGTLGPVGAATVCATAAGATTYSMTRDLTDYP